MTLGLETSQSLSLVAATALSSSSEAVLGAISPAWGRGRGGWSWVLFSSRSLFSVSKPQVLRLARLEEMARAEQGCPEADSSDINIIKAIFKL